MHALLVIRELIGFDAVRLHVLGTGVAVRAGRRDIGRMHLGARVRRRPQFMNPVAIGTHGDFAFALGPPLAVDAGLILLELVYTQAGIVLLHQLGIGVAGSAQLRNLTALDLAFPARRSTHRLFGVIAAGIAP